MKSLELWLVSYLANSLWMIPVIFTAAWAAARLTHSLGSKPLHRVWALALLTEALFPAIHLRIFNGPVLRLLGISGVPQQVHGGTTITLSPLGSAAGGRLLLSHGVIALLASVYTTTLAYLAVKFAYRLWKTYAVARRSQPLAVGGVESRWRRITRMHGFDAAIAESGEIAGPVTVGMIRGVLLLPRGFAEQTTPEDLDAVMAHECAHMVRRDFAKNVFYSLVTLPCGFHPFLWMTQARMSESREMVCDHMAAEMLDGPKIYARSLLRLASAIVERNPANLYAIGIFDANHLERRIMSLTNKRGEAGRALRIVTLAACVAIGLATWASAMTLRTDVGAEVASTAEQNEPKGQADLTMPVLIHSETPTYPSTAKNDHVSGTCLVALTVDEQGAPTRVHILKSLRSDFDENAVKAVKQYRFKPALRAGKPVPREIKVEVRFAYF